MYLLFFQRYEEAAQHIFDALVLQDADGVRDPGGVNEARGITSSVLWESLKTSCFHMQRLDLATLCDRQDLEGIFQCQLASSACAEKAL
jgi:peroxin-5